MPIPHEKIKELENLYERYNYKQMDQEERYALVKQLLTYREIFAHFFFK